MANQTIAQIANQLVDNCRSGNEMQGLDDLYADNAVSVEAMANPATGSAEVQSREGIRAKHEWWNGAFEVHEMNVEGPFLHGENQFSVIFELDSTDKASNERTQMKEVAVYTVENNKIAKEQFFYGS